MKTLFSAATLAAASLLLGAAPQQNQFIPTGSFRNILGNGGFEAWNQGNAFQGPIGPDLWLAMGDTSDVFSQGDIAFTRVTGCAPAGNGSVAMQVRANLPQSFVSQSIENYGEYAGRDLTFSISARPLFPLANARIEVDDGVGTSMALITVTQGQWGRITLQHKVDKCPTKLEFKIYPEQTIDVDQAMALVGTHQNAVFVPRPNPEPSLQDVPLGTVLDWFRFDASIPVPEGFAICDGSPVADAASPFLGKATPNLLDRFVRGVTSVGSIGSSGGASSHSHGTTGVNQGGFGVPPGNYWFMSNQPFDVFRNARDGHTHSTSSASSLPPYVGLLKIIRIK
jgi:hypothetical protein